MPDRRENAVSVGARATIESRMRRVVAATLASIALLTPLHSAHAAGYAVELDGISGYLGCDLSGAIRDCGSITLAAWILTAGPRGELISPEPRGQAAVGLGFHFGLSGGKVSASKGIGSGSYITLVGSTTVPVGSWHHVAATFDGSTMRVYVDGALDGSLADASVIDWADLPPIFPPEQVNYPTPAQLYIGADKHNQLGLGATIPDFEFFNGDIDEAQIWNRALTQTEIDTDRWLSLSGFEPGLVAYWKFDEGMGNTASDATHQNHLTLYPGVTWTASTAPVATTGVAATNPTPTARLAAFPNPTRGQTTIVLESGPIEHARVSVFDVTGRRVAAVSEIESTAGRTVLRWDGRDDQHRRVPGGIYLVCSESAGLVTRLLILR